MIALARFALGFALCAALAATGRPAAAAPAQQETALLQVGDVARGQLDDTLTEGSWRFAARAGDSILIDMKASPGGSLDPYLTLFGPDGANLASDDDSGEALDARIGPFQVPVSGTYHITASRYNGTGEYTLQIVDLRTLPTLQRGKPLAGQITLDHPADYFLLGVPAAGEDAFWQIATDAGDFNLLVLTVLGVRSPSVTTEDSGDSALGPLVLSPGARYIAVVTSSVAGAEGAYEIRFDEADVTLLEDGTPQTREVSLDGEPQRFFFRGIQDERVAIAVSSDDRTPVVTSVGLAGSGEMLFANAGDDAYAVTASLILPQDALYEVSVSPAGPGGGPCTVMLTRLAD